MSPIVLNISRRARTCCKGGEPFLPGNFYHTKLDKHFQRFDFCESCWKEETDKGLSHWTAKVPEKTLIEKKTDRLDAALECFKMALEEERHEEAYILSLFLARKKIFILRDEYMRNKELVALYEVRATEEMIEVPRVLVTNLKDVQESIAAKLKPA